MKLEIKRKDWIIERLGDFAISEKGKKPKNQSETQTEEFKYPYVDIQGFEKHIFDSYTDGVKCNFCTEDDFLMVWDGSRSGLVGKAVAGTIGSTLVKINLPMIENHFAYYFLKSKYLEINTNAKGTGTPHVNPDLLWNYSFPIVPTLEQKEIVAKIEQLFSELDNAVVNLETAKAKLKIYRQAVLKKAFEGELTKEWREKQTNLPTADEALKEIDNEKYSLGYKIKNRVNSWSYYPIGNICEFQQGMQIAKSSRLKKEEKDTLPILRIKNYRDGFKTDVEHIKIDEKSLIAEPHDLIVTRTGESRGDILTGFRGVFHNNTFRINYDKNIFTRKYLLYYLTFSEVQNYIKFVSGRTGQPDLTHRNFGPCPVIIPSILEQAQIVQEIESRLSVCDKIEETIENSLAKSEALRQSILKKAFEGKLLSEKELENIKNHPEYESAKELLKRIKKERDK